MIVTHASLEGYFQDLVREAVSAEKVPLDDHSTAYIVQLVAEFMHREALHAGEEQGDRGTPALFRLYERAVNSAPRQQFNAYRHLGDVALFVSGFFAPHIERSMVSVDYYVQMGGSAYHRAAVLDRSGAFAPLLNHLATMFQRVVEVLTRVAEQTTLPVARDIAAIYERWMRSPNSRALVDRLVAFGAIPILQAGGGDA